MHATARSLDEDSRAIAPNRVVKFARDVGVNVVANLVAAIIYVCGVLAGVLPRNPTLYISAIGVVAGSLAVLLFLIAKIFLKGAAQRRAVGVCMMLLGLASILGPFIPETPLSALDNKLYPAMGIGALLLGLLLVLPGRENGDN